MAWWLFLLFLPFLLVGLVILKLLSLDAPCVHVPIAERWVLIKKMLYALVIGQKKRMPHYLPPEAVNVKGNKFITGWDAAKAINDGDTVCCSGFGAHSRNFLMFYTVADLFKKTGHPKDLRWVTISAQGGRGRVPGTVEDLAKCHGLVKEYVASHHETAHAMLKAAQKGQIELQTIPLGATNIAYTLQGEGQWHYDTASGVDTFMDPRVGTGSAVSPGAKNKYIEAIPGDDPKDDKLRLTVPKLNVAYVAAPYCDKEGNIYFLDASCISDMECVARACHANKGTVIAVVSQVIEKRPRDIALPTEIISHVVVHPLNEQLAFFPQNTPCMDFLPPGTGTETEAKTDVKAAYGRLTWVNKAAKIAAVRTKADAALAQVAASIFVNVIPRGSVMNIGVGLGEELGTVLWKEGLAHEVIQTSEGGAWGGIPLPGVWFGGSILPQRRESSTWMFRKYEEKLDCCILGFLEVDTAGNVNVSKKGDEVRKYIGPGGFADISNCAKNIFFMGAWMASPAKVTLEADGSMKFSKRGKCKFVEQVKEVTFSGKRALLMGKNVWYVSHTGVFKLTEEGLTLIQVFPGIDIEKDIVKPSGAKIVLPPGGPTVVDRDIMLGKQKLSFKN